MVNSKCFEVKDGMHQGSALNAFICSRCM